MKQNVFVYNSALRKRLAVVADEMSRPVDSLIEGAIKECLERYETSGLPIWPCDEQKSDKVVSLR